VIRSRLALVGLALLVLGAAVALRLTAPARGLRAAQRALDAHDLVAAETAWRGVLADDPGRAEALYGLGWTLHLGGRPELAREAFLQCVDAHPDSPLGYKGLGSVAMSDGNPALARQRFEEALARAPGDRAIRHSLGLLDLASGKGPEAVTDFQALVAEEPTRAAFRQALAEALLLDGKDDAALDAASEAVRLSGDDSRSQALSQLSLARALLAVSARRVDAADCASTAPPVYAWLDAADRALDEAEATGVPLPDLVETRRSVRQRRGAVDDRCPGIRVGPSADGLGRKFPDG
jgi:predicted Zn-dependent protease